MIQASTLLFIWCRSISAIQSLLCVFRILPRNIFCVCSAHTLPQLMVFVCTDRPDLLDVAPCYLIGDCGIDLKPDVMEHLKN